MSNYDILFSKLRRIIYLHLFSIKVLTVMYQQFEWKDNHYQVGLFTFYKEKDSLETNNHNPEALKPTKTVLNKIKIKTNVKQSPHTKRYGTQYMYWSIEKNPSAQKVNTPYQRTNTSEKKIHQFMQQTSLEKQRSKVFVHNRELKNKNKSLLELKKRNVNEIFKFDIYRDRTKMFVYRGEKTKESINFEKEDTFIKEIRKQSRKDPKLERCVQGKSGYRLNQLENAPKISLYSNFVQLLVQKRKKQICQRQKQRTLQRSAVNLQKFRHREKTIMNFFQNTADSNR